MPVSRQVSAAAVAVALLPAAVLSQDLDGPLLDPQALQALGTEGDVQVIDIRAEDAYAEGHVDGAVVAPYALFRGPSDNPGQVPDAESLQATIQSLGIEDGAPVVITYGGEDVSDFGAAARVYWTLKSAGVEDLAILNGGISAWQEAGLPLSDQAVAVEPSGFEVAFSDEWLATEDDVQAALDAGDGTLLLDARPESFWRGEQSHSAAARPGTLPQSQYFTHNGWFEDGPAIVDAAAAQRLADENGLTGAEGVISFCNTGHWAATNWFALSELAGIDGVKLYPESLVGWSNAGREMANVPGPIQNLWYQIKGIF